MDAFVPARRRRPRNFRERPFMLDLLSPDEVINKYRLSADQIFELLNLIEEDIRPKTDRSHPLSPMTKLLVTLQYLAKAEFYSEGGLTHGVSKSAVCTSIWQVVGAINRRLVNIQFPTTAETMADTKRVFWDIAHIPNCLGAVDGTQIAIIAPRQDEATYVCRKGYHSINVQATVDSKLRFTDVVARWPGSTHDSTIFDNCGLKVWLEDNSPGWLLGDSGYPLRPYLMTPKINPQTRAEVAYNTAHSRTRMVVERAFGLLKSRFRCLHKTGGFLQVRPERAAELFVVCAKLHNLCMDNGVPNPDPEVLENGGVENGDLHEQQPEDQNARRLREGLIERF